MVLDKVVETHGKRQGYQRQTMTTKGGKTKAILVQAVPRFSPHQSTIPEQNLAFCVVHFLHPNPGFMRKWVTQKDLS